MDRLSLLRQKNPGLEIHTVDEALFSRYARLVSSPVFAGIADYIDRTTTVPERNTYVADIPEAHSKEIDEALSAFYGGMVPQIGYCNGPNFSINGSEYHKGPELTIAITDCLMWWMLPEDLIDFDHVDSSRANLFYIPKGCAFLLKPEILHLAPCKVDRAGYKTVIILPMGTNSPIEPALKARLKASGDPEAKIIHMTNKYMITHKDWQPLVSQGVHIGLLGENRSVNPID
jgi:hypothetical protein